MAKNRQHKVQHFEWLGKIAHRYSADEKKVWDDPANAKLREHCPNPNVLCQGRTVELPPAKKKDETEPIDAAHKHVVKRPAKARLRLKLQHYMDEKLEEDYELEIGGEKFTGRSTNGEIDHEVKITSDTGVLRLPKRGIVIVVRLGDLEEVQPWHRRPCHIRGAQARLSNLAFTAGPEKSGADKGTTLPLAVDGVVGPKTRRATGRFQAWAKTYAPGNGLTDGECSPVDKKLGPLTAGCLKKCHGV